MNQFQVRDQVRVRLRTFAVTIPVTPVTDLPSYGDLYALPWMSVIATQATSGITVPTRARS